MNYIFDADLLCVAATGFDINESFTSQSGYHGLNA
jgi:hypothetical protein